MLLLANPFIFQGGFILLGTWLALSLMTPTVRDSKKDVILVCEQAVCA
jgi:hypothetical protein